jgi:HK97 gp10 family phage protein
MKADTRIEIKGIEGITKVLGSISSEMRAKITREAVDEVGKVAVDAMNFLAPVRTGTLKRALGHKSTAYPQQGTAVAIFGAKRGRENWSVTTENGRKKTNIPTKYAHLVEFGRIDRGGKFHPPTKAFLRPAIDAVAPRAGEIMARKVFSRLERTAKKFGTLTK